MSPHSLNQFLHLPPFNKDWFFYNTAWHSSTHKKNLEYTKLNMYISCISLCWFSWNAPERFVANTPWQHLRLAQWSTDHFPKSPRHPEGEGETCRCDFCFIAQFRHMIHEARFCQRTLSSRLFVFFLSTRWTHQRLFALTYKHTVTVSNPTPVFCTEIFFQNTCNQGAKLRNKTQVVVAVSQALAQPSCEPKTEGQQAPWQQQRIMVMKQMLAEIEQWEGHDTGLISVPKWSTDWDASFYQGNRSPKWVQIGYGSHVMYYKHMVTASC